MAPDILLVEDDPDLREEVAMFLRCASFAVREYAGVAQAASAIRERRPDAALIDVLLPDGSGLALLPILRSEAPQCVNFMLSARFELQLKLDAYRQGADNYLVKPIDPRELAALLNAFIARVPAGSRDAWIIENDSLTLRGPNGLAQTLSLQEITILKMLAAAPDRFVTRRSLVEALGYDYLSYNEQRLEAVLSRLRKKIAPLGENPIKASHGRGYVFTQTIKMASLATSVLKPVRWRCRAEK